MVNISSVVLAVVSLTLVDISEVVSMAVRAAPLCRKAAISIDVTGSQGAKTGKGYGSSIQFVNLSRPIKIGDYVSLDFKTEKDAGLLIYLASRDLTNYIQVFLHKGQPRLRMKCGDYQSNVHSHMPSLKDGEFHELILRRSSNHRLNKETILIDSQKAFRTYPYQCPDLEVVFLGGFPSSLQNEVNVPERRRLQGCLKNFRLNGNPFDEYARYTSVSTC